MKISISYEKYHRFEILVIVQIHFSSHCNLRISWIVCNTHNSMEDFSVSPAFQGHYGVRTSILKFQRLFEFPGSLWTAGLKRIRTQSWIAEVKVMTLIFPYTSPIKARGELLNEEERRSADRRCLAALI